MTPEIIEEWATASRAAQGLPPLISDPKLVAQFVQLVIQAREEVIDTTVSSTS